MSKNPGDNESSKEPRMTTFCLTKNVNNKYPKLGKVLTECKVIADLSLSRSTLQVSAQGQSDEGIAGEWPHFPFDHKLACNK